MTDEKPTRAHFSAESSIPAPVDETAEYIPNPPIGDEGYYELEPTTPPEPIPVDEVTAIAKRNADRITAASVYDKDEWNSIVPLIDDIDNLLQHIAALRRTVPGVISEECQGGIELGDDPCPKCGAIGPPCKNPSIAPAPLGEDMLGDKEIFEIVAKVYEEAGWIYEAAKLREGVICTHGADLAVRAARLSGQVRG